MLDIKFIRENPEVVKNGVKSKGVDVDIDKIIDLDKLKQGHQQTVQKLQEERNTFTKTISGKPTGDQIEIGKKIREKLEEEENAYNTINSELNALLLKIPNLPKPDVKIGKDDSENEVLRKYKDPIKLDFAPKDHLELGETLDIIDVKSAAKVSGARFGYLKNDGALLEFALKQLAFDLLLKEGFIPVVPPVLIKKDIMDGLGYTAMGEDENIFFLPNDNLYLVGTAEQSIVPLHMNDTLSKNELPKRYVGFSTSFRREAGSYGKDTKGIFRVHQFNKVEMVSFVEEGKDDAEHEYMLSIEEKLFQMLDIPYQVVAICTGDLGFNAARKYDIEAWIPSQDKYREVTSTSTVTDFQSRRLNMKYQDGDQKKYLQVLNGTAFSMNRPIIAILENYQQADGSILIPEALRKYMGKDKITLQK
ncbi:MAG TPA: serine--tRNA ligase [Candidatus Limnocylindrales bacterium]|nr:serine--tRNA ligase [Candidatus Limnocylindrales bacterium]